MALPVTQRFNVASVVLGPQQPINWDLLPLTQTTIAVSIVSGTAAFSVEFTLDDLNDPTVSPQWFTAKEFPVGTSASTYAAYWQPWRFVRLNLAATTGAVTFQFSQSTNPRV